MDVYFPQEASAVRKCDTVFDLFWRVSGKSTQKAMSLQHSLFQWDPPGFILSPLTNVWSKAPPGDLVATGDS